MTRSLDSLLRRGADLPVDVACAVLTPVAATLDALHRRGRAHGTVAADRIMITVGDRGVDVEILPPEPFDTEPDARSGGGSDRSSIAGDRPSIAADRPSIAGDYVSFGSLLVRGLVRTLGPDDRRALSQGHDPVTGRRATSCASLVEAARVAVAPLPGGELDRTGFWDDLPRPMRGFAMSGSRRLVLVAVAVLGVVGLLLVLVTRSSGGTAAPAPHDDVAPPTGVRVTTTTGAPGQDAAATLSEFVPVTLRDACRPVDAAVTATSGVAASVECEDDGRQLEYTLFDDADTMSAAFTADAPPGLRGPTDLAGPARCAEGEVEERAWSRSAGDPPAGRYRCEMTAERAAVVWTTDAVGVLARVEAAGDDADLPALFSLWRSDLGPVTP
ncbi:MAG: hypothetical protein M5U31_14165 [Acidimicrobiia bacterium]|nr:hypothetical protein [Acidimicrobiia bacterium]